MSGGQTELGSYEFDSDLSLEQMHAALNAEGSRVWGMGDSYWYGDYLRTGTLGATQIRIIEHGAGMGYVGPRPPRPRYLIGIKWASSTTSEPPLADLDRIIREQILPLVRARDARVAISPF